MFLQQVEQGLVVSLGGYDDDIAEILCCSADEADTADVNLFDDVCLACSGSHCVLEGIEIDDDKVDGWDVVLLHLLLVTLVLATAQNAAKHLWVQRLDSAAQNAGIRCYLFHLLAGDAETLDESLSASCGKQFNTFGMERSQNFL